MDLNYLFHRQQVERTRSEMAESAEARAAHEEFAKRYEERIETVTSDDHWFPKDKAREINPTLAVAMTAREFAMSQRKA